MNSSVSFLSVAVLVGGLLPAPAAAGEISSATARVSDPKAIAIADQVMRALGGRERWDALVGLRWTFEVGMNDTVRTVRRHSWNKHTGEHRVSGTTRDRAAFTLCHDLDTGAGMAWMGGIPIEGDSLAKLMKRARSLWTNDTYWMLMPYKLRDPGVILGYDGTVRVGDRLYDKLALSFEGVGETPDDRYWVYVDQATHRVDKWEMVLQGDQPPPQAYTWEGWEQHVGLWFATTRRRADGRVVFTRNIEAVSSFPSSEFTQP